MHFLERLPTNHKQGQIMHICTVIKENVHSLQTERNKCVFKRDLDYDSDGAHLSSLGIEFLTEEEAK